MIKNILQYMREHGLISTIKHSLQIIKSMIKDNLYRGNYYADMNDFINTYKNKYPRQHRKAAFWIICWQILSMFRIYESDKLPEDRRQKKTSKTYEEPKVNVNKLNIGILLEGGLGDYIIVANYIYKFRERFNHPDLNIEICYGKNERAVKVLFGNDIVDKLVFINREEFLKKEIYRKYDLFFDMERIPFILKSDVDRIGIFSKELAEYVTMLQRYMLDNSRYSKPGPRYHGQVTMLECINGRKRIQQPDVNGFLGVTEEYKYQIEFDSNKDNIENKWGIDREYIAIVSGADVNYGGAESNKIWPEDYWKQLLLMIKEKFPQLAIVQLGVGDRASGFEQVDYNLLGQTSIEETMVLLKYAKVLISNEGGLVHLRHAVHGGVSLVLFGSTDEKFFGYSKNYNIRGNGCPYSCEWQCRDWQRHCFNGVKHACMLSLKPDMVMNALEEIIEKEMTNGQEE